MHFTACCLYLKLTKIQLCSELTDVEVYQTLCKLVQVFNEMGNQT